MAKRKQRLSALVLAALCVSTLTLASCGEEAQQETGPKESEGAVVYTETGMQTVLENDVIEMQADLSTGEVSFKDKRSGKTWYSNPQDLDDVVITSGYDKNVMGSQLAITINIATESNREGNLMQYASFLNVNRNGELSCKLNDDSVIFSYYFKDQEVRIPIKYMLTDTGFTVEILTAEIEEYPMRYGVNRLRNITLLPAFGAGNDQDEGYLLVPDGSGALINFNNNKAKAARYGVTDGLTDVYGRNAGTTDRTVRSIEQYTTTFTYQEQISLPIFGEKINDDGYLAVIEGAPSRAVIYAQSGGQGTPYNCVYSAYKYREAATIRMLQKGFEQTSVEILENEIDTQNNYKVEYIFLESGKNEYTDMAEVYRQKLIAEDGLEARVSEEGDIPFYLELFGYIRKTKPFLGIPTDTKIEMTSFEDALDLVGQLRDAGITNTVVKYDYWQKNGYYDKLQTKADVEGMLGGKSDLAALETALTEQGGELFLSMEPMNAYQLGNGVMRLFHTLKSASKTPQMQFVFALDNASIDTRYDPWYLVRPQSLAGYFTKFLSSFEKLDIGNLALESIGSLLYSELGSDGISREESKKISEQMLDDARQSTDELMLVSANAYAAARSDHILETPMRSSNFDVVDADIPFYQILLHGYVNYSLPATNLSSNPEEMYLHCLETGASPLFVWVAQNSDEFIGSRDDDMFSSDYTRWMDLAVEDYQKINEVLSRVKTLPITGHQVLGTNVRMTEYGGTLQVIVNYNEYDVTVNGETVPANGYIVKE